MRVLALSLVTNNAVLDAGPRGDSTTIQDTSHKILTEVMAKGKANHDEVLHAGQEADRDVQVRRKSTNKERGSYVLGSN